MCNVVMHEHDLWQSGFVKLRSSAAHARAVYASGSFGTLSIWPSTFSFLPSHPCEIIQQKF